MSPSKQQRADAIANRQKAAAAAAARQRRNRWLIWGGVAAVVVVAIVVAVVASGSGDNASARKFETHAVTVTGTPLPQYDSTRYSGNGDDPAIGMTIPTVTGVSVFDGNPVTITPNGKPQAIVFVAHWCPHCQAEVPKLVSLAERGVFDGIDVTAVATGTNSTADNYPPSSWLERGAGRSRSWPTARRAPPPRPSASARIPYFVLVDADGKVVGPGHR